MAHFLAAVAVTGCTSVEYADKSSVANPLDKFESDLVTGLNELRKSAGVPELQVCASLNVATSAHGDDMRDKGYLSDVAPDKSTTVDRACDAGYQPACNKSASMVAVNAKGHAEGTVTLDQLKTDPATNPSLTMPEFVVVGVGRSLGGAQPIWSLDMANKMDASCTE